MRSLLISVSRLHHLSTEITSFVIQCQFHQVSPTIQSNCMGLQLIEKHIIEDNVSLCSSIFSIHYKNYTYLIISYMFSTLKPHSLKFIECPRVHLDGNEKKIKFVPFSWVLCGFFSAQLFHGSLCNLHFCNVIRWTDIFTPVTECIFIRTHLVSERWEPLFGSFCSARIILPQR